MPEAKRRGANVCRTAFYGFAVVWALDLCPVAEAQIPPSAAEIAAYGALHRAAYRGDLPALRQAVAAGRDLEIRDGQGRSALHAAAHANQAVIARLLLDHGADATARDAAGRTPLDHTSFHKAKAAARVLAEPQG